MFEKFRALSSSISPAYFGVGMGLGGLATAWTEAAWVHPFSMHFSDGLFILTFVLSSIVMLLYASKLVLHFDLAFEDFCDTNIANFFPGFTITLLLLASWFDRLGMVGSTHLWTFAALAHVGLAIAILRIWIIHNVEITRANPSMFVPIAGLFVVPATLPAEGSTTIAMFCFAVALLFWLALLPVVLNRILFHGQVSRHFLPTLFVLIAPPALAASATSVLMGGFTPIADLFFFSGLFMAMLLTSMARRFFALSFRMSWWAFTFPSAALAGVALKRYAALSEPDLTAATLAISLLLIATLIIGYVSWCTFRALIATNQRRAERASP